jgi:hypothetical protein
MQSIFKALSILLSYSKLDLDQLTELRLSVNEYIYQQQSEPFKSIAMELRQDIEVAISDIKYQYESQAEIERQHQEDGC